MDDANLCVNPFEEDDLAALHDIVADVPNDFLRNCNWCNETYTVCESCWSTTTEVCTVRCLHGCHYTSCLYCDCFDDEVEEHKDRFHELKKELEQFDLDINKIKDFYIELYIEGASGVFIHAKKKDLNLNTIVNTRELAGVIAYRLRENYEKTGVFGIGCMHVNLDECDCSNSRILCYDNCVEFENEEYNEDDEDSFEMCSVCEFPEVYPWQTIRFKLKHVILPKIRMLGRLVLIFNRYKEDFYNPDNKQKYITLGKRSFEEYYNKKTKNVFASTTIPL